MEGGPKWSKRWDQIQHERLDKSVKGAGLWRRSLLSPLPPSKTYNTTHVQLTAASRGQGRRIYPLWSRKARARGKHLWFPPTLLACRGMWRHCSWCDFRPFPKRRAGRSTQLSVHVHLVYVRMSRASVFIKSQQPQRVHCKLPSIAFPLPSKKLR